MGRHRYIYALTAIRANAEIYGTAAWLARMRRWWNACVDSQTELIERLGQAFDAIDAAAASADTSTPED